MWLHTHPRAPQVLAPARAARHAERAQPLSMCPTASPFHLHSRQTAGAPQTPSPKSAPRWHFSCTHGSAPYVPPLRRATPSTHAAAAERRLRPGRSHGRKGGWGEAGGAAARGSGSRIIVIITRLHDQTKGPAVLGSSRNHLPMLLHTHTRILSNRPVGAHGPTRASLSVLDAPCTTEVPDLRSAAAHTPQALAGRLLADTSRRAAHLRPKGLR